MAGHGRRQRVDVVGVDESLRAWADRAVTDLAERLEVPRGQVHVAALGSVTWSDTSCGCPRPGMAYAQVPVDGAYARLEVGARAFHYHGTARTGPFLCSG